MENPETKRFIPKGFELGTTLSQPNWSIHPEPQKSDAQPFRFACEQSENIERSRINDMSGQNSFVDENEAPKKSEVIVTLLNTKAG